MKKIIYIALLFLCVFVLGGCSQEKSQTMQKKAREAVENIKEAADGFSLGEPSEVRELREKEVSEGDGEWSEYFFSQLDESQKRIYREILEGVQQYEEKIYISSADNDAIDKAYHAVLKDHPEIFWIHNRETTYKTTYSTYAEFEPGYRISQEEAQAIQASMEEAYQQVAAAAGQDASDYEKAKAAYEYVILHTEYGYSEDDQSIAGVFRDGKAVCAGYSGAVQYLLERMGVECLYVTGQSDESPDGHAWNIVNLGGSYYYLDATNGDQPRFLQGDGMEVGSDMVLYDYLCPFPAEYESMSQSDEEFAVPECTSTEENYYVRNGNCFEDYQQESIYQYACGQISQGQHMIHFKFTTRESYEAAAADLIQNKAVERIAQYFMDYYGIRQVEYHYGILEDLNTIYFMM